MMTSTPAENSDSADDEAAWAHYEAALALVPDSLPVRVNGAILLLALGRAKAANALLEFEIDPNASPRIRAAALAAKAAGGLRGHADSCLVLGMGGEETSAAARAALRR